MEAEQKRISETGVGLAVPVTKAAPCRGTATEERKLHLLESSLRNLEMKWAGKIYEDRDPPSIDGPYPSDILESEVNQLMASLGFRLVDEAFLEFGTFNKSVKVQVYEPDVAVAYTYIPATAWNGYHFQQIRSIRMVKL